MLKSIKGVSLGRLFVNIFVYLGAFIFIAPFLISLVLSLKTPQETAESLLALPRTIRFENFTEAIEKAKIFRSFYNSILVTGSCVIIITLFSAMAGYGIGRFYNKRSMRLYEVVLLASMMIPFQTIMIPVYKMLKATHLMNTSIGAILIISGTNLAFSTMMYIGFVKTIPLELEEAAYIEGYDKFRIFTKIVLPLLSPITYTIVTLSALWTWNEFNVSLIVLQKDKIKTIPMQQYVFFSQYNSKYNLAFAAAIITMIPIVIFFISVQKYIIKGLSEGAIKG